jgi:uncharacterized membrane protein
MTTGIIIAFAAQLLLGGSLVIDKILLSNSPKGRVMPYVFWIGILNIAGLAFLPFGFHLPSLRIIGLALIAGVTFFISLIFYYFALSRGEATESLPIVGGFAPLATFLIGMPFALSALNIAESIAFVFLVLGGFLLFISGKFAFKKIVLWVFLAAVAVGLADTLQKLVFLETNFATGFVLMKLGTFLAAVSILIFPKIKLAIKENFHATTRPRRFVYFLNRLAAGIGSVLVFLAIKAEPHPALIEAINGFRYIIVFILIFLLSFTHRKWLAEHLRGWILVGKIIATALITIGLAGLGLQRFYQNQPLPAKNTVAWGATFSTLMAKNLGLDWRETYRAIVNNLKPHELRIASYWDQIELRPGKFVFDDLDWQVKTAADAHVPLTIVIGEKTPRWPECHFPGWLDTTNSAARKTALLNYLKTIVSRYKNYSNLLYWQVENEPFLLFGECPTPDAALLDSELATVRESDPNHPALLTDGGEFGDWFRAASRADVFGTTLYRKVNTNLFGRITWPLTPQFYPLHRDLTKLVTSKLNEKFIVAELGLEPWTHKQIYEISLDEQLSLFNFSDLQTTIQYARETGFDTFYLWGTEWWYWLKTKAGHPEFWNYAAETISGN